MVVKVVGGCAIGGGNAVCLSGGGRRTRRVGCGGGGRSGLGGEQESDSRARESRR